MRAGAERDVDIAVRVATPADVDAVTAVHLSSTRVAYEGILSPEAVTGGAERRRRAWHRYLTEPPSPHQRMLAATVEDKVVGFAALGPSRDDDADPAAVGEVYALYVEPSLWRRGVGRRLLSEAERLLGAAGLREATLWVLSENHGGRSFYETAGWRPDGREKHGEPGGQREVRYRRSPLR